MLMVPCTTLPAGLSAAFRLSLAGILLRLPCWSLQCTIISAFATLFSVPNGIDDQLFAFQQGNFADNA